MPPRAGATSVPTTALFTVGAWGLLAGVIALVGTSAAPAIAREMGLTEISVVRRDFQRSAPAGQAGVEAVRDFERDIGGSIDRLERGGPSLEADEEMKLIFTKKPIQMKKSPSARSVVAMVPAGTALVIVQRDGNWLQVVHQAHDESLQTGWVELRDLELP